MMKMQSFVQWDHDGLWNDVEMPGYNPDNGLMGLLSQFESELLILPPLILMLIPSKDNIHFVWSNTLQQMAAIHYVKYFHFFYS